MRTKEIQAKPVTWCSDPYQRLNKCQLLLLPSVMPEMAHETGEQKEKDLLQLWWGMIREGS